MTEIEKEKKKITPHTGIYPCHVQVWLTRETFDKLNHDYRVCGYSTREAYLRQLIAGVQPKASPPLEYWELMTALRNIGNNMNQVAAKAHRLNVIDVKRYDDAYHELQDVIQEMTKVFIIPGGV